jgi:DNA-binding SARP family transcriptional activator
MVTVQTLGKAVIDAGSSRVTPTSPRKFALLLYLSAEPGRRVARSVLRDLIFPEQTEKNALHSLRELVYQLRQSGVAVDTDSDGIAICRDAVRVDYVELLARGRFDADDLRAIEGGFLPGYAPAHSEAFGEWYDGHRARTTFDVSKALIKEVMRARSAGDWRATERAARACLVLDPLNEEGHLALAETLAIGGSKVQAVKLLERYMEEVGASSRDLRLPAALLRRRVAGNLRDGYSSQFSSPFVGRDSEIARLSQHLSAAEAETVQCVLFTGEPGIGKSRLIAEFCTIASLRGAVISTTTAHAADPHRPFGAFADLLPSLLSLPGSLGCAPEALRLLERLIKSTDREDRGVDEAGPDSDSLSHSITLAIVELIDSIASEQPVVLAIEDAQWLDRLSSSVLVSLSTKRKRRRLLTLLAARQARSVGIYARESQSISVIDVGPIDDASVIRITNAISETTGVHVDAEMQRWLAETSAGNPLFLETLLAHFASTHQRFSVSPSLSSLVERRLESLSDDAGTTLRICALLGKYSTLDAITQALQVPGLTLLRAISELEAARLVSVQRGRIRPSHPLIAEVAQRDWAPATKHVAHQCVASALEHLLTRDASTAVMWDCAEHWIAANNSDRALHAIRRCAARALEMGRPADAAEVLSRALHLEIGTADQMAICRQLVQTADEACEPSLVFRGLEVLRKHDRSQQHDDIEFAEFRAKSRLWSEAPQQEERLLSCAGADDASPDHRVTAAIWLLKHADVQQDEQLRIAAEKAIDDDTLAASDETIRLEFLLVAQCARSDWDQTTTTARNVLSAAARTTSPQVSMRLRLNACVAFERCGRVAEAVETARALYVDAESRAARRVQLQVAAFLADYAFDKGDDVGAFAWFERVSRILESMPDDFADFSTLIAHLTHFLTVRNVPVARSLFDRVERSGWFDGGQLRRRWYRVLSERLRQIEMRPSPPDDFIAPRFSELNRAPILLGLLEFELATACYRLVEVGRPDRAEAILKEYAAWRHARQPQSRCLQVLRAELDALSSRDRVVESSAPKARSDGVPTFTNEATLPAQS